MPRPDRILVVDDDSVLPQVLSEVLADEGHDIRVASHGADGLDRLVGWEADLIILDLMMPVLDGYAFRAAQLERGLSVGASLVILSAVPNIDDDAVRLRASAWLAKPFDLDDLLETIDRLLGDRRGEAAGNDAMADEGSVRR